MKVEVQMFGETLGVILPDEILAKLGFQDGDVIDAVESADRSLLLTPRNAPFGTVTAEAGPTMGDANRGSSGAERL